MNTMRCAETLIIKRIKKHQRNSEYIAHKRPDEQNSTDTGRYGQKRPRGLDVRRSTCSTNHPLFAFHSCCKHFEFLKTSCGLCLLFLCLILFNFGRFWQMLSKPCLLFVKTLYKQLSQRGVPKQQ